MPEQQTIDIDRLIHFWEVQLQDRAMLSITTAVMIEQTIQSLKMLAHAGKILGPKKVVSHVT
jgi:hypothetical protein